MKRPATINKAMDSATWAISIDLVSNDREPPNGTTCRSTGVLARLKTVHAGPTPDTRPTRRERQNVTLSTCQSVSDGSENSAWGIPAASIPNTTAGHRATHRLTTRANTARRQLLVNN
jgi:hypothetical protein